MFHRLASWLLNDPIHSALTVGFGCAIAACMLEVFGKAIAASAPAYALFAICLLGVAAVAQAERCARFVAWLITNEADRRG
jgi:hypothetical protein